jgi:hypothetical protein
MNWRKRLSNPFLLAFEGFLLGGLLFVAANPGVARTAERAAQADAVAESLQR